MFTKGKLHIIFNDGLEMVHRLKKAPYAETKRLLKKQDYSVVDTMYLTVKGESTLFIKDGKPQQKLFDFVGDYPICTKYQQLYSTQETLDSFKSMIVALTNTYIDRLLHSEFHAELVDIDKQTPAVPIYNLMVTINTPIVSVEAVIDAELSIPPNGCINVLRGNNLLLSMLTSPNNRHYSVTQDLSDLFKEIMLDSKQ